MPAWSERILKGWNVFISGVSAYGPLATSLSHILRQFLPHTAPGLPPLLPNPQSGTDKRNDEDEPLTLEGEELVQRLQASAPKSLS